MHVLTRNPTVQRSSKSLSERRSHILCENIKYPASRTSPLLIKPGSRVVFTMRTPDDDKSQYCIPFILERLDEKLRDGALHEPLFVVRARLAVDGFPYPDKTF